jgi:hypothetical protein
MAFDLSTTSRKAVYNKSAANPQLYDKSYNLLYNKSTANPQQIEQVEFELKLLFDSFSCACTQYWTPPSRCRGRWLIMLCKSVVLRGICMNISQKAVNYLRNLVYHNPQGVREWLNIADRLADFYATLCHTVRKMRRYALPLENCVAELSWCSRIETASATIYVRRRATCLPYHGTIDKCDLIECIQDRPDILYTTPTDRLYRLFIPLHGNSVQNAEWSTPLLTLLRWLIVEVPIFIAWT